MKNVLVLIVTLTMVLSMLPAVTASAATDEGLIFYASFDEDVQAETGKVNTNGSGFEIVDGAVYIPSGTGNFLTLTDADGNNNLLVGKEAVTISFFENREGGTWPMFVARNSEPQKSPEYYLGLFHTNDTFKVEHFHNGRGEATGGYTVSCSKPTSGWRHVAIVVTGTYTEVFVNGATDGKVENSAAKLSDMFPTESVFQMGRGNWTDSGEDFFGYIDEVKIFNRALNSDEISALSKYATPIEEIKRAIAIPNADNITGDIALVTSYRGATIKWTSSNPDVVTNEGKVTRPSKEDISVTMTANITNDAGEEGTAQFVLTVKSNLAAVIEEIRIKDAEDVRDSVTLVKKVGDIDITWKSSDPAIVTDEDKVNSESGLDSDGKPYVIPAGYVTRTDKDETVTLTAEFTYEGEPQSVDFELTVKAKPEEEEKVAYLYAYFRGNVNGEAERLSIHFATSEDGYNWTDLNGNFPVIESTMGTKSLRDPYILRSRYGDKFYLVATDLNTQDGGGWDKWSMEGSKYLMVWASEDLVDWGEQRMVKFANDDIGCAWAPESVYDVDTGEYLVYASGKDLNLYKENGTKLDTVFVSRTRDFYSFSEPEMFFEPLKDGKRVAAIDSNIIRADDGKYYHFYKKENGYIMMMVSDHAAGPYTEVPGFETIGGEGPATYKVNGKEQYALCVDNYSVYVPYLTDNISSGKFTRATSEVTMPTGSKHGGMIPISQREYDALMEAYGPEADGEYGADPVFTENFDKGASDGLMGGAKIETDSETGSNVLVLDGVKENASYFKFPEKLFDRHDNFTLLMDVKSDMSDSDAFFTFALGQGDGTDHYMFFRARQHQLRAAETVYGWQHEREAKNDKTGISGEWARIALVVKPGYLAVYKDGVLMAENTNALVGDASLPGGKFTTSHLGVDGLVAYLGKSFFPTDKYMKGSFDNIAVYDYALTNEDILADYCGDADGETIFEAEKIWLDLTLPDLPAETRDDISFINETYFGNPIQWASSDYVAIDDFGNVTRPPLNEGDKEVTLTGTVEHDGLTATTEQTVTVKAGGPYWNAVAGDDWTTMHEFDPVGGKNLVITFDMIPHIKADTLMAFGPAALKPNNWGMYNVCVRINGDGKIQANTDGGNFAGDVDYELEKTYSFVILVYPEKKQYDSYVREAGEGNALTLLASGCNYRAAADGDLAAADGDLAWMQVKGGNNVGANAFSVDNLSVVGIDGETSLRISGGSAAPLGIAYDLKLSGRKDAVSKVYYQAGAAKAVDGNYTDLSGAGLEKKEIPKLSDNGEYRVSVSGISNANSARSYQVKYTVKLYNGYEVSFSSDARSLYGVLADSIANATGTKIPDARLKAANEIIGFVEQSRNDKSEARFPGLTNDRAKLFNADGSLNDKAKGLGINPDAAVQLAETLALESVEIKFVETEIDDVVTGDITAEMGLTPEL